MKKNLNIIAVFGLIGSLASIISLIIDNQILNDNQIHLFYGGLIFMITILTGRLIFFQKRKIDDLKSPDEKIKEHLKKYPFHPSQPEYFYSGFIQASKSFIRNNKEFFSKDFEDLMALADQSIEYGNSDSIRQDKHYQFALELKNRIESHLIRIGEQ
jgi:hypothetical protein